MNTQFSTINNALARNQILAFTGNAFAIHKKRPRDQKILTGVVIYKKIDEFIKTNSLDSDQLRSLDATLTKKAKIVHSRTVNLKGFFYRVFAPKVWLNNKKEEKAIKELKESISAAMQLLQNPPQNDLPDDDKTPSDDVPTPINSEPPTPPPPPAAPIAPTLPPTTAPTLSEEEQHAVNEANRLERLLKERANPDSFYIITPSNNAATLTIQIAERQKEIQKLLSFKQGLQGKLLNDLNEFINEKEEKIRELKAGLNDVRPIQAFEINTPSKLSLNFLQKVQKLTNDEIAFLLGQYFDSKKPANSHANFQDYQNNKALFDAIFARWDALKNTNGMEFFEANKDGWNNYLGSNNIRGLIAAANRRALDPADPQFLFEPEYKPTDFGAAPIQNVQSANVLQDPSIQANLNSALLLRRANLVDSTDNFDDLNNVYDSTDNNVDSEWDF